MLSVEDQIVLSLRSVNRANDVRSRQLLQTYGITAPQLAALREAMVGQVVSASSLAAALHLTPATLTGILARLEQRGLIERTRSAADRRTLLITVTERGRRVAAEAPPLLRDGFCHALRRLPACEQQAILHALEKVAALMHAPRGDGYLYLDTDNGTDRVA